MNPVWVCNAKKIYNEFDSKQCLDNKNEIETTVVLATACVRLQAGVRITEPCRAMLDTGAEASVIQRECVNRLQIPAVCCKGSVIGVTGAVEQITEKVIVHLKSIYDNDWSFKIELYVMNNPIDHFIPLVKLPTMVPDGISLADPGFRVPAPVQILLSVDVWARIQGNIFYRHNDGAMLLQETALGYVVFGRAKICNEAKSNFHVLSNALQSVEETEKDELSKFMRNFWRIEEIAESLQLLSPEAQAVEQYFMQTHRRNENGRYVVFIPLKENALPMSDTRNIALRRFHQLERKLQRDSELKQKYVEFMKEYEELGHMKPATRPPKEGHTVYIPHHAINKKFRIVFDASVLSVKGISFNKLQYVGPKLQLDLQDQLLCFRLNKIAFTADIEKMFRQVLVDPDHWDYQRIFWREEPTAPLKEYWLVTVTYGMAISLFNAVRAMIQCARDHADTYPAAAKAIEKRFYADDGLLGAESIEQAIALAKEIDHVLKAGGFVLRHWASNSRELVRSMTNESNVDIVDIKEEDEIKVLGVRWLTNTDQMTIAVNTEGVAEARTKRQMLSYIAKLYDPNGFVSPVVMVAKVIMQDLWRLEDKDWDKPLSEAFIKRWKNFCSGLEDLKAFRIPRWVYIHSKTIVQLHGFADACFTGYGAGIYVRTIDATGAINSTLFCAKSRVAPIKALTTERLELEAAVVLSNLMEHVLQTCEMADVRYFLYTDSAIVYYWLHKQSHELKRYVAFRVSHIHSQTKQHAWRHVSSKDNPADLISRGAMPKDLMDKPLWLHGPEWLMKPEAEWPQPKIEITPEHREKIKVELKPLVVRIYNAPIMFRGGDDALLNTVSCWQKLIRITGYVLRFRDNMIIRLANRRQKRANQSKIITGRYLRVQELEKAANFWIKIAQAEHFQKEIENLKMKEDKFSLKSKIAALTPFLDGDEILRAGGRIKNAKCTYNKKHPVIVPSDSKVCTMILQQAHEDTLHGGVQLMMRYIRNNYWIPKLRAHSRSIVRKCAICIRQAGQTSQQIMADLPVDRLVPARPFLKCGVDLAGPFNIRITDKRYMATRGRAYLDQNLKGYAVIYVCLVTRAVHLEAVMAYSAEAFLTSFKRFVARRGAPEYMYSDQGTNLVRADKDLQEAVDSWASTEVQDYVNWNGVQWKFIVPSAPHQGGIWEAAVKQMKHHMKRIIGADKYTYEAVSTLLAEIEACMNSRPICAMSDDPNDVSALTPAHFLIGEPLKLPLPARHDLAPKMAVGFFKELQVRTNSFWRIWSEEYLSSLLERPKWRELKDNLRPGQLVLIKNENLAPTFWPMGRVIQVKKSKDGCVRSALIKTQAGELERPVQKLVVLPVDEDLENYS